MVKVSIQNLTTLEILGVNTKKSKISDTLELNIQNLSTLNVVKVIKQSSISSWGDDK